MKIGILTFHYSCNFGAGLQALATQEFLRARGIDAVVINYRDPSKVEKYQQAIAPAQAEMHEHFCRDFLRQSPLLRDGREVESYCKETLDAIWVGSDAVFSVKAKYDPRHLARKLLGRSADALALGADGDLPPYFAPWSSEQGIRPLVKASIAASATGTPFYFLGLRRSREAQRWLNDFDVVSVRDHWTRRMVRALTWGRQRVMICPDPVFVLNQSIPLPECVLPDGDAETLIFVSGKFPDEWLKRLRRIAHEHGYRLANLPNPENEFKFACSDVELSLPMSPLQWYGLLARAGGFIGTRFHAMVSCLANQTPAISVDSGPPALDPLYRYGSKYRDLCLRAGVESRYFTKYIAQKHTPEDIFAQLFDTDSQRRANAYARVATVQFSEVVDQIVSVTSDRLTKNQHRRAA